MSDRLQRRPPPIDTSSGSASASALASPAPPTPQSPTDAAAVAWLRQKRGLSGRIAPGGRRRPAAAAVGGAGEAEDGEGAESYSSDSFSPLSTPLGRGGATGMSGFGGGGGAPRGGGGGRGHDADDAFLRMVRGEAPPPGGGDDDDVADPSPPRSQGRSQADNAFLQMVRGGAAHAGGGGGGGGGSDDSRDSGGGGGGSAGMEVAASNDAFLRMIRGGGGDSGGGNDADSFDGNDSDDRGAAAAASAPAPPRQDRHAAANDAFLQMIQGGNGGSGGGAAAAASDDDGSADDGSADDGSGREGNRHAAANDAFLRMIQGGGGAAAAAAGDSDGGDADSADEAPGQNRHAAANDAFLRMVQGGGDGDGSGAAAPSSDSDGGEGDAPSENRHAAANSAFLQMIQGNGDGGAGGPAADASDGGSADEEEEPPAGNRHAAANDAFLRMIQGGGGGTAAPASDSDGEGDAPSENRHAAANNAFLRMVQGGGGGGGGSDDGSAGGDSSDTPAESRHAAANDAFLKMVQGGGGAAAAGSDDDDSAGGGGGDSPAENRHEAANDAFLKMVQGGGGGDDDDDAPGDNRHAAANDAFLKMVQGGGGGGGGRRDSGLAGGYADEDEDDDKAGGGAEKTDDRHAEANDAFLKMLQGGDASDDGAPPAFPAPPMTSPVRSETDSVPLALRGGTGSAGKPRPLAAMGRSSSAPVAGAVGGGRPAPLPTAEDRPVDGARRDEPHEDGGDIVLRSAVGSNRRPAPLPTADDLPVGDGKSASAAPKAKGAMKGRSPRGADEFEGGADVAAGSAAAAAAAAPPPAPSPSPPAAPAARRSAYVEPVLLPRPLFFGRLLPPRVLDEARRAARAAAPPVCVDGISGEGEDDGGAEEEEEEEDAPSAAYSSGSEEGSGGGGAADAEPLPSGSTHSAGSVGSGGGGGGGGGGRRQQFQQQQQAPPHPLRLSSAAAQKGASSPFQRLSPPRGEVPPSDAASGGGGGSSPTTRSPSSSPFRPPRSSSPSSPPPPPPTRYVSVSPEYRNLEGAIGAFGCWAGRDVFRVAAPSRDGGAAEGKGTGAPIRGAYVATYQPVWGDRALSDRENQRKEARRKKEAAAAAAAAAAAKAALEKEEAEKQKGKEDSEGKDGNVEVDGPGGTKSPAVPLPASMRATTRAEKMRKRAAAAGVVKRGNDKESSAAESSLISASSLIVASIPTGEKTGSPDEAKPAQPAGEASKPADGASEKKKKKAKDPAPAPAVDNQFLQWARGDAEGGGTFVADKPAAEPTPPETGGNETDNQFLQWARGDADGGGTFEVTSSVPAGKSQAPQPKAASPEQNQFLQWARGGDVAGGDTFAGGGTFVSGLPTVKEGVPAVATDTFRPIRPTAEIGDSDSFEGSEMKKQVGISDNLNAALASLVGEEDDRSGRTESMAGTEAAAAALLAAEGLKTAIIGGRPMTNLELTGGCVPLYGCDDTPLPIEADLGVFETKDDQIRSLERRKSEEIIQRLAVPKVFGPIMCPSTCTGPDDSQSWNSRSVASAAAAAIAPTGAAAAGTSPGGRDRGVSVGSSAASVPSPPAPSPAAAPAPAPGHRSANSSPSVGVHHKLASTGAPTHSRFTSSPPQISGDGSMEELPSAGSNNHRRARSSGSIRSAASKVRDGLASAAGAVGSKLPPVPTSVSGGPSSSSAVPPPSPSPAPERRQPTGNSGIPSPPPPINTDPAFLRDQRGQYGGSGGLGATSGSPRDSPTASAAAAITTSVSAPAPRSGTSTKAARQQVAKGNQHQRVSTGVSVSSHEGSRVGWWNDPADTNKEPSSSSLSTTSQSADAFAAVFGGAGSHHSRSSCVSAAQSDKSPIQLPPSDPPQPQVKPSLSIHTHLRPTVRELRENNRPLSELHPASSCARVLPYLSDRHPSTRYIQIDTQKVGFQPLGEIEALFCTVAIWHVETTLGSASPGTGSGGSSRGSVAPVPNLQRCGRITEALHFDVVNDPEVVAKCASSLWPFAGDSSDSPSSSPRAPFSRRSQQPFSKDGVPVQSPADHRLKGTRCGVFPLPSNFNLANLHAVLIIHKVLSEDTDIEPYMKPPKTKDGAGDDGGSQSGGAAGGDGQPPKDTAADLAKLRQKASKTSDRLGKYLMPFAFGVAPLLQVIGSEVPAVPASRAVHIPLFKVEAGKGERPIIDHIMVILHPSRDKKPAEVTRGGSALLTIRNFGYLGLHSVVHSKSKLARDRLVDFTGELQLRRRSAKSDERSTEEDEAPDDEEGKVFVSSPWRPQFVAEPTIHGGRNIIEPGEQADNAPKGKTGLVAIPAMSGDGTPRSHLYAQELAPVPLSVTPHTGRSSSKLSAGTSPAGGSATGGPSSDAECYFHTSFSNELLAQPRLLHNCRKRNVVVKVEIRELRWCEWIHAYVAELPGHGPCVHNNRRGPFLVQEAYTSCAYHIVDPMFLDEFKIKLPLSLGGDGKSGADSGGRLVALFTVCNVSVRGKRKWTKPKIAIQRPKKGGSAGDGDDTSDTDDDDDSCHQSSGGSAGSTEQLACGLLPLTNSTVPCLIPNGLHDVKLKYYAKPAPQTLDVSTSENKSKFGKKGSSRGLDTEGLQVQHRRQGSGSSMSSLLSSTSKGVGSYPKPSPSGKITFAPGTLVLEPLKRASDDKAQKRSKSLPGSRDGGESGKSGGGVSLRFPRKIRRTKSSAGKGDEKSSALGDDASISTVGDESLVTDMMDSSSHGTDAGIEDALATPSPSSLPEGSGGVTSPSVSGAAAVEDAKTLQVEAMVLQVRTVAISSVHPQNICLARFFLSRPKPPRGVTQREVKSPGAYPWRLSRDDIVLHSSDPAKAVIPEEEHALLQPTVELSKSSLCPHPEMTSHLIRVTTQLWLTLIGGAAGEPSLLYANPASLVPLRLHSFATLLHAFSAATAYMAKCGVTQLDGKSKINLTTMGWIMGLLFDEEATFLGPDGAPLEDFRDVMEYQRGDAEADGVKNDEPTSPLTAAELHPKSAAPATPAATPSSKAEAFNKAQSARPGVAGLTSLSSPTGGTIDLGALSPTSDSTVGVGVSGLSSVHSGNGSALSPASSVTSSGTTGDRVDLQSTTSPLSPKSATGERKIDTKADFQQALKAASNMNLDGLSTPNSSSSSSGGSSGSRAAMNMISAFGTSSSGPASNRRKWMTAPSSALATIREDDADEATPKKDGVEGEEEDGEGSSGSMRNLGVPNWEFSRPRLGAIGEDESLGRRKKNTDPNAISEAAKRSGVKQMRVPNIKSKKAGEDSAAAVSGMSTMPAIKPATGGPPPSTGEKKGENETEKPAPRESKVPQSDDEIEVAGTKFLEVIGKNLGFGAAKDMGGEEKRVGFAHHRKTRSRCSIDWTLPPTDLLLESEQQLEHVHRKGGGFELAGMGKVEKVPPSSSTVENADGGDTMAIASGSFAMSEKEKLSGESSRVQPGKSDDSSPVSLMDHPLKRGLSPTKRQEGSPISIEEALAEATKRGFYRLPSFIDRIAAIGKTGRPGRWFAYAYEVVIFQWVALLVEQVKGGDQSKSSRGSTSSGTGGRSDGAKSYQSAASGRDPASSKCLRDAASRARGVTISCAPILFEIIKKSLGFRIDSVFRKSREKIDPESLPPGTSMDVPPLVSLDSTLLSALEELLSMVTDACIDSRNFDSWQFRQTSIDVNDAIVRFLRDLFAYLEPSSVHRLCLVYFSRFVMKEGKHWQDRDSKIGLRCSWETCKLRLNAITLFIRFPEFFRVNTPLMETWDSWAITAPAIATRGFFKDAIEELESFSMSSFAGTEGPIRMSAVKIPKMKPHWLVELVTDVCLSAAGHAEQSIQHRASSLLLELFWAQGQEGKMNGNVSVVSSMFVPFISKVLTHINYLSSLPAKSQLRKDILPCAVFIMQSAPVGLMRALWRKLCRRAEGKGRCDNFGGIGGSGVTYAQLEDIHVPVLSANSDEGYSNSPDGSDGSHLPDILDVFSLLNLVLKTFEYEGSEANLENGTGESMDDQRATWRTDFLMAVEEDGYATLSSRPRAYPGLRSTKKEEKGENAQKYTTSSSRKWHAHDGGIVVINTCRYIVREALFMLRPSEDGETAAISVMNPSISLTRQLSDSFIATSSSAPVSPDDAKSTNGSDSGEVNGEVNGEVPVAKKKNRRGGKPESSLKFTVADTVIFARATTSVYLHALSLRESDVVIMKTLTACVEIVKIFGIKVFLAAVGETLQHWMRVVLMQCGARRAEVRVQALEFLALILRLTWDSFGSFYRIRVPLLAVQTEVMERIVATAATRYYREQRKHQTPVQYLSNDSAEASLAPLWRTLDRLHHQSASQNVAFRSALMRLAEKMKCLFRAYIAAHALAIVNRMKSSPENDREKDIQAGALFQSNLVTVHRITSTCAGYSKQFLGSQGSSSQRDAVVHGEAVEDAFLSAADVFSPTELPSHRVAWLRKLAEFHSSRSKFAEEATCRFHIHVTLRQAARVHDSLWNSVPFLPWASDSSDGVHLEGDGPAGAAGAFDDAADYDSDDMSVIDNYDDGGKHFEKTQSFRRIFYRVANSVRMRTGDWDVGGNRNLFYGVTFASEYNTVSPWISLREMEEDMIEETETAGDLYLKAGIPESSRFSWSLATQFYSESFNYARLAYVYRRLARVVASKVPVVDTSNQLEVSSPLGRFYRVWFHGGAPDELMGAEFVYRASSSVKLEEFGMTLKAVLKRVLPEKTPIDLVLDDGRPEDMGQRRPTQRSRLGAAPREPIKVKVTPLRPLLRTGRTFRGTAEWFYKQTEFSSFTAPSAVTPFSGITNTSVKGDGKGSLRFSSSPRHRSTGSRSMSSSFSNSSFGPRAAEGMASSGAIGVSAGNIDNDLAIMGGGELVGVEKFSFTQPIKKDRARGSRDWLKSPSGDFAEKSLRVTQITVEKNFPACVSRQPVVQRTVFTQSPLEAGVEAVCSWCAVLFRTAVATNGLAVIGTRTDQGIGTAAAKVVADCIHCSHVKEIGLALLTKANYAGKQDVDGDGTLVLQYAKLSDNEIRTNQIRLARATVMFMELLHLLIARNRDLLLAVVQARKRSHGGAASVTSASVRTGQYRGGGYVSSPESAEVRHHNRHLSSKSIHSSFHEVGTSSTGGDRNEDGYVTGGASVASVGGGIDRTDSAIAVQSELQRAFIAMAKTLYPLVSSIIFSEAPRWLKSCCQDNYFSSGMYKHTRIAMGEELFFFSATQHSAQQGGDDYPPLRSSENHGVPLSIVPTRSETPDGSYAGSSTSKSETGKGYHRPSPS